MSQTLFQPTIMTSTKMGRAVTYISTCLCVLMYQSCFITRKELGHFSKVFFFLFVEIFPLLLFEAIEEIQEIFASFLEGNVHSG